MECGGGGEGESVARHNLRRTGYKAIGHCWLVEKFLKIFEFAKFLTEGTRIVWPN